jgi:hypothetical protein
MPNWIYTSAASADAGNHAQEGETYSNINNKQGPQKGTAHTLPRCSSAAATAKAACSGRRDSRQLLHALSVNKQNLPE